MAGSKHNIKYTAVLPSECVDDLKDLASNNFIPSVNFGIRLAVERFVSQSRRELYEKHIKEAAEDKEFINRTLDAQNAFSEPDLEVGGHW